MTCVTDSLNLLGLPCDMDGHFLPENSPSAPWEDQSPDDFSPFQDHVSFELADLLYRRNQMSASHINDLLELWTATLPSDQDPPFTDKQGLYDTIDDIELGDAPWKSFSVSFNGELHEGNTTSWKHKQYDVWYRDPHTVLHNQLGNRNFALEMDFAPKEVRDEDGKRRYLDFMSGDWAWRQAVRFRSP
jgi:hypothetical protein